MCGISGFIHFDQDRPAEYSIIKKMTDVISYRGPDGEGFHIQKNVALGHRRLSILDLDTGNQPMLSEDQDLVLVFNGEIYNYLELKSELSQLGYHFRTSSDTEVILHAYRHWGYECQSKFNGMWAFALWDNRKQELFISRDRIGEKPLHYAIHNNTFVFGSELKSIFQFGVPKVERLELTEIYLTLTNIPAPHTFYKGVFKLMPGHFICVRNNKVEEYKYWDLPEIDERNMLKNTSDIYDQFEYLLRDSVKIRMRSDVPFGAFLSGGLDSSAIVSLMSEQSTFPVNTFTIGFNDKAFDESQLAQDVANKFKTNHYRGTVKPENFEESLEKIVFHYDEPFGDSSAIPTGYVSKFASEKVKMVLTGDGGDEVLSGYKSYQGIKLSSLINRYPDFLIASAMGITKNMSSIVRGKLRYKMNKVSSILQTAQLSFVPRVAHKTSFTDLQSIKLLSTAIPDVIPVEEFLDEFMNKCTYNDDFYKMMYLDYKHGLPNDYLVKVDRMSMAASLEARVPFLDHRLVEYMVQVDKNVKLQGWERKSVLRKTIGPKLPKSILDAPKKGFGIPLREWFKDDSFQIHINQNLKHMSDLLDKRLIDSIINANNTGQKDNGNFIWTMMVMNSFLK